MYKTDSKKKLLVAGIQAAIAKGIYAFSSFDVETFLDSDTEERTRLWYYYKSMNRFRAVVRDEAIRTRNPRLIVQIASLDPPMSGDLHLPDSLVFEALESMKTIITESDEVI